MKLLLCLLACALLSTAGCALAAAPAPFEAAAFKAAAEAGKPVIIEVHADWCGECKAQNQVLTKLTGEPAYANLVRFRVDYDRQKDLVKKFGVRKQSTLVLYKGNTEVARLVGETAEAKIKAMLGKAI
ncbi:MAG: thioredoxin fold domain-containing protein [Betaproteobacteria bacterium]|nr:thioredoxin fold domain-containing protein [Betaproteobacteria bacterium]